MFCRKDVLKDFTKFSGKHLCQSVFLNKDAGLRPVEDPSSSYEGSSDAHRLRFSNKKRKKKEIDEPDKHNKFAKHQLETRHHR